MKAYCMKCRTKREMNGEKKVKMKNGRAAVKGTCSKCGTKRVRWWQRRQESQ
jgi:DNA-directed RNA polymerase subunit M/transcription elongation factor TFIIS